MRDVAIVAFAQSARARDVRNEVEILMPVVQEAVERSGMKRTDIGFTCSGSSDWKLKASPEDGRIEVEGEVDSNKVGQTWRWRILHNGEVSARGKKTTKAPSGSFEVRRLLVDLRGDDGIGWRARNPKSGEVCRGRLVF